MIWLNLARSVFFFSLSDYSILPKIHFQQQLPAFRQPRGHALAPDFISHLWIFWSLIMSFVQLTSEFYFQIYVSLPFLYSQQGKSCVFFKGVSEGGEVPAIQWYTSTTYLHALLKPPRIYQSTQSVCLMAWAFRRLAVSASIFFTS